MKKLLREIGKRPIVLMSLLGVPILLFCLEFLLSGNRIAPGDADYIMQAHEAARISILEHGQFPWWNPWISGGVPLYANPQFGLISLQSLTTLLFGTITGYKIAIAGYFALGFYGFYVLYKRALKTPVITAILLAYIWTFGSFLVHRASGHYTFFTIQFFPLLLYFFLTRHEHKRSWLYFGLTAGLMANAAAHNTTIMSFFVMALFIVAGTVSFKRKRQAGMFSVAVSIAKQDLIMLAKAAAVFLVVAGHRLYYAFSYVADFPREFSFPETSVGIPKALYAMFGPLRQFENTPTHPVWSWLEVSVYIGILTLIVGCIIGYRLYKSKKDRPSSPISLRLVLGLMVLFFAFGLGDVLGPLSAYNLLELVPVISEMRVATRWLFWSAMMFLLFIALYRGKKYRGLINTLLLITVVELFFMTRPFLTKPYVIESSANDADRRAIIDQQQHYNVDRLGIDHDENLRETTELNIGQIIAGDALVDTRNAPPFGEYSNKCDQDEPDCSFVLTNNAEVVEWTPNKIVLERTAPGWINLNMNPGREWMVNEVYTFLDLRKTEANKLFLITDESETITLEYVPKYSHTWLFKKLGF